MDDKPTQKIEGSKDFASFLLPDTPAFREFMKPMENPDTLVNDEKIRKLYVQAQQQQWFPPKKLDFEAPIEMSAEERRVWIKLMTIFYTLEKMGLDVIDLMMYKAVKKFKSDDAAYYLALQCADEARHVFVIENYLRKLGAVPRVQRVYRVLGQVASMGIYRVENWLFSTLFSENFASAFLRKARVANIDPFGSDMCKTLLMDESRHLHFLHIVLPDLLERMSSFGRAYLQLGQAFSMRFTEKMSMSLAADAAIVGINRVDLLEDVFANMERAYDNFGIHRKFLAFPKIRPTTVVA